MNNCKILVSWQALSLLHLSVLLFSIYICKTKTPPKIMHANLIFMAQIIVE